jgi:NAD(P)-dependent dehydrogenase (short-subunit alcohol dehydrogenase family)
MEGTSLTHIEHPMETWMDFKDKVVLVTGASRGIGRACAQAFAKHGAHVAVHYHEDQRSVKETLNALPGGPHEIFRGDISQHEEVKSLIEDVVKRFGRLDVLVNNAGIFSAHPIDRTDYDRWLKDWQKILATNLQGPANLIYWAARQMMKQGGGRIVNISSRGAFRGEPDAPAYGASKAGLNALSQSLAQALALHNIFVTVVAPGFVETDMATELLSGPDGAKIKQQSPLGRVARPEEVARVVLFLASEDSDYLTGAIIDVNGASYLRS